MRVEVSFNSFFTLTPDNHQTSFTVSSLVLGDFYCCFSTEEPLKGPYFLGGMVLLYRCAQGCPDCVSYELSRKAVPVGVFFWVRMFHMSHPKSGRTGHWAWLLSIPGPAGS